jgi:hypothetical protein
VWTDSVSIIIDELVLWCGVINMRKCFVVWTDAFGDFDCTTGEEVAANGRKV